MTSGGEIITQIKDPDMQVDSYMGKYINFFICLTCIDLQNKTQQQEVSSHTVSGYSVSAGEKKNNPLYFSGAPRFEHTGQVVLFTRNDKKWTPAQRLNGDQVGL